MIGWADVQPIGAIKSILVKGAGCFSLINSLFYFESCDCIQYHKNTKKIKIYG